MARNFTLLALVAMAFSTGSVPALAQSTITVTATADSGSIDGDVMWSWNTGCNPDDGSTAEVDISVGGYFSDQSIPTNESSTNYGSAQQLQIFGPGSYPVSASWSGFSDGHDNAGNSCSVSGSSGSAIATVAAPVASAVAIVLSSASIREGQPATVTVNVTGANAYNNGPAPTGSVELFYQSTILKSGAISSVAAATGAITGGVSFTLSSSGIPPGTYMLNAVYNGDNNLTGSSSPPATLTITASQGPTTTALATSTNTLTAGQSVTLTAAVTPTIAGITPSGTVNFLVGTTSIGTAKLNSSGVAIVTESATGIPPGAYPVHASYGGDAYDYASASSVEIVTVQAVTATTLTANPTTVKEGSPVIFTATVKRTGSTGIPTGELAFQFAGYTFAAAAVNSSGVATTQFSTANLQRGSYPITAVYNGDTLDATSTSTTVTITVQ